MMRSVPLALVAALTVACTGPQAVTVPTAAGDAASPQGATPVAQQPAAPTAEQIAAAKQTLAAALPASVPAKALDRIAAGLGHFGADLQIAHVTVGENGQVNAPPGADVLVIKTSDTAQTKVVAPAGARAIVFDGAGGVNLSYGDRPAAGYRVAEAGTSADVTVTLNAPAEQAGDPVIDTLLTTLAQVQGLTVTNEGSTATVTQSGTPLMEVNGGQVKVNNIPANLQQTVVLGGGSNAVDLQNSPSNDLFTSAGQNSIKVGTDIARVEVSGGATTIDNSLNNPTVQVVVGSVTNGQVLPDGGSNLTVVPFGGPDSGSTNAPNTSLKIVGDALVTQPVDVSISIDASLAPGVELYYTDLDLLCRMVGLEYSLGLWGAEMRAGAKLKDIAAQVLRNPELAYLTSNSDAEFAEAVTQKLYIIDRADLKQYIIQKLSEGMSRADVLALAVDWQYGRSYRSIEANVVGSVTIVQSII